MSTGPWSPDTPDLLASGAVSHVSRVVVTTPDGDTPEMAVTDGTLTYDDTRTPRVELSLTCHLDPPDSAMQNRIDPRKVCNVALAVGYARSDGTTDIDPIVNLGLRSRNRSRPDDTLELTSRGDEALLLDNSPSTTLAVSAPDTAQGIEYIIHTVLPSATVTIDVTTIGPAVAIPSTPDLNKWNTLSDLADQITAQVYDDGTGAWWIVDRSNAYTTPAVILRDGANGTLVSLTESNDRESNWFNRVKLVHKWTDASSVDHRIAAGADATGTYAPVTGNVRVLEVDRVTPITQAQANLSARTLVDRAVSRGRVFQLVAVSCYWLRPGHTVQIEETGRDPEQHLVRSVSFNLRTGLMAVSTRQPE